MIDRALELVDEGMRGGECTAFVLLQAPRLAGDKSCSSPQPRWLRRTSTFSPWDTKPVGEQVAVRRILLLTRTVAWAIEPAFLQGWVWV